MSKAAGEIHHMSFWLGFKEELACALFDHPRIAKSQVIDTAEIYWHQPDAELNHLVESHD